MESASSYDDRPPLEVERLTPEQGAIAREVDRNLGLLEVAATHARNLFRDAVAGDTLPDYRFAIGEIARLTGEIARVAESQRTFFDALQDTVEFEERQS